MASDTTEGPQAKRKPPTLAGSRRWVTLSFVFLLVVVGGGAAYMFSYVAARESDFSDRAFRSLAAVAEDFNGHIQQIDQSLQQVSGAGVDYVLNDLSRDLLCVDLWQRAREEIAQLRDIGIQEATVTAGSQRDRELLSACWARTPRARIRAVVEETIAFIPGVEPMNVDFERFDSTGLGTAVRVVLGETARFQFRYDTTLSETAAFGAEAALTDLLDASDVTNEFDEVFLALSDGTVLYRGGGAGFRITDLDGLLSPIDPEDTSRVSIDSRRLGGSSRSVEVELAGEQYVMFVHPMRPVFPTAVRLVGADEDLPAKEWLLGGLVHKGRLSRITRQLPADVMMVLLVLLVGGLLAAPFLKVAFLGTAERYGAFDVLLLWTAGVVATALVTLVTLDAFERARINHSLDEEAHELWGEIVENLDEELRRARVALGEFFSAPDLAFSGMDERSILGTGGYRPILRAPFIEMAFWADRSGAQRKKWTVKDQSTVRLADISDRYYFRAARPTEEGGSLVPPRLTDRASSNDTLGFAFEVIRARTTGESFVTMSVPLTTMGVAGFDMAPLSITSPALPVEYSFALVDSTGRVILRSGSDQHSENLVTECGDDGLLRSALGARRPEHLTLRCHGVVQRAYMGPLGDQAYTLIVLRAAELFAAINFEVALSSLVIFSVPALASLVGMAVLLLLAPRVVPAWLWPDKERTTTYFQAIMLIAVFWVWISVVAAADRGTGALWIAVFGPVAAIGAVATLVWCRPFAGDKLDLKDWTPSLVALLATVAVGLLGALIGVLGIMSVLLSIAVGSVVAWLASPHIAHALERIKRGNEDLRLRIGYSGLILSGVLLLGTAPAVIIFRDAFEHGIEKWTRLGQLHAASAYRAHRDFAEGEPRYTNAQHQDIAKGEYQSSLFEECLRVVHPKARDLPSTRNEFPPDCGGHSSRREPSEAVESVRAFSFCGDTTSVLDAISQTEQSDDWIIGVPGELLGRHFTAALTGIAPVYSPAAERFRRIAVDRTERNRWRWIGPYPSGCIVFADQYANGDSLVVVTSRVLPFLDLSGLLSLPPTVLILAVLSVAAALVLALGATHAIARRIFGIDLALEDPLYCDWKSDETIEGHVLLLGPPENVVDELAVRPDGYYVDLRDLHTNEQMDEVRKKANDKKIIVLDHLEYGLENPEIAETRLALVETLLTKTSKYVALVSTMDPLYRLQKVVRSNVDANDQAEHQLGRWAYVLAEFRKCRFGPDSWKARHTNRRSRPTVSQERPKVTESVTVPSTKEHTDRHATPASRRLVDTLQAEFAYDENVQRLATDIRYHHRFPSLTPEQVIEHVGDRAEGYYYTLWQTCDRMEKLVLIRLAQTGFVNPKTWDVVRRLRNRGLVRNDPAVRLMNKSFREFVLRVENPATIAQWEREQGVSAWSRLRGPLLFFAIAGAIFFFLTQRERFTVAMGFVGSLAALIPALVRILSLPGRGGGGSPSSA